MTTAYELFSDGAARGNPGPAGAGALLRSEDGEILAEISEYLGETTNNQAEYQALLLGLKKAEELKLTTLKVFLDSELVVKQLNGDYKVKHPDLIPLYREVSALLKKFPSIAVAHVYREKNKEADKLANLAIDNHFSK
jgi:ribonuclease HI